MLKVAVVGCGKIADSHASQIARIKGAQLVATCDREVLMARQLAQRFSAPRHFVDVAEMLSECRPDVVHLSTPPETHFALAKMCLEAGSHVYVEKPFTLDAREAHALIALAEQKGLKVTAGHDDQFSHVAQRLRELVRTGYLGGTPVHMESYFCYELGQAYARALFGDKQHWVRRLPGKLLHNIISHGIARIAEFFPSDLPQVMALGFASPLLRRVGETEILDELRVIISDENGTTAYFTFSSQMRPSLHQFSIYGPKNSILLDQDHEILLKLRGAAHKSYLEKFVPPLSFARQHLRNFSFNARAFLRRDFHPKAGMYHLIKAFYESIAENKPVPIPYREILLTATIMDQIFQQIGMRPQAAPEETPSLAVAGSADRRNSGARS